MAAGFLAAAARMSLSHMISSRSLFYQRDAEDGGTVLWRLVISSLRSLRFHMIEYHSASKALLALSRLTSGV